MAVFSRLPGLRRSRLLRAVVGGSALAGAAAGGAAGAAVLSADRNAQAEDIQPAAKAGMRQVSLDVERRKVRVAADLSLLGDSFDTSSAGAMSLHGNTPNTPDNTGGAENTGNTPNTPDNTGGAENTGNTPNTPDNTGGAENTTANTPDSTHAVNDSPSNTSVSVQGSSSGSSDGVSDGAADSPSSTG
jgi:hypothetical protein